VGNALLTSIAITQIVAALKRLLMIPSPGRHCVPPEASFQVTSLLAAELRILCDSSQACRKRRDHDD
jgi:hypothetical protein